MRPRDRSRAELLGHGLRSFNASGHRTPGLRRAAERRTFIEQLLESIRRVSFPAVVSARPISPLRREPRSELFDPIRAAVLCARADELEEAFWLVFLSVHFGKHKRSGWQLVKSIYGRLDAGPLWDWGRTAARPRVFRSWLRANEDAVRATDGGFGNHRKYQSLSADSDVGTGVVVETYVRWVKSGRTHVELVRAELEAAGGDSRTAFHALYQSMDAVVGFGRTARFDYLTMIGKLGLADIEPGSVYLAGATGPLTGARLLFGSAQSANDLDRELTTLGSHLGVGMQVLEDALCNWQKSPSRFIPFRG